MKYPGLQTIIDILKNDEHDNGFNMCRTACCIGGHARIELRKRDPNNPNHTFDGVVKALQQLCNIPYGIADELCFPQNCGQDYDNITKKRAIHVLEQCRDTGVPHWGEDYQQFL